MIRIDPSLNELEVLVVLDYFKSRGISSYTLIPGNQCIWAYYGVINQYFIFREGKLVDIQVD